jgi:hypothetical protein
MSLEKLAADLRKEFLSHVRPEVLTLASGPEIEWDSWCFMRLNGYERELLYPKLTTDALVKCAEQSLSNCEFSKKRPSATYNDLMLRVLVPLLIERLK